MVFSKEHQLDLPDSFPNDEMIAFMAAVRETTLKPTKSDAWKELAGASNLIGWRFRGSYEDMNKYISSWKTLGPDVPFEEIYQRDRALFGMFSAGVSCIESACYALAALSSHPKVLAIQFGDAERRRCNPLWLKKTLADHSAAHAFAFPLAFALGALVDSSEWSLWVSLRNRMTHRSNLPRIVQGAAGAPPPRSKALHFAATSSTPPIEDETSRLDAMFAWLANTLRILLVEGQALANRP